MSINSTILPMYLLLAVTLAAPAQDDVAVQRRNNTEENNTKENKAAVNKPDDRLISEDLKIMSVILRENVEKLYGRPAVQDFGRSQGIASAQSSFLPSPLGVRLAGYGVVLQMRVPPPKQMDPHKSTQISPKKNTRWELTRLKLTGEQACLNCHSAPVHGTLLMRENQPHPWHLGNAKSMQQLQMEQAHRNIIAGDAAASNSAPTEQQLVDALVATLLEHAHHFRTLSEHERVAFAVEYSPPSHAKTIQKLNLFFDPESLPLAPKKNASTKQQVQDAMSTGTKAGGTKILMEQRIVVSATIKELRTIAEAKTDDADSRSKVLIER